MGDKHPNKKRVAADLNSTNGSDIADLENQVAALTETVRQQKLLIEKIIGDPQKNLKIQLNTTPISTSTSSTTSSQHAKPNQKSENSINSKTANSQNPTQQTVNINYTSKSLKSNISKGVESVWGNQNNLVKDHKFFLKTYQLQNPVLIEWKNQTKMK
jgi:hypothetical protein